MLDTTEVSVIVVFLKINVSVRIVKKEASIFRS